MIVNILDGCNVWMSFNRKKCEEKDEKDIELKNLKLYLENQSIVEENEKLRKKAGLLHQENLALMYEFQNKFPDSLLHKHWEKKKDIFSVFKYRRKLVIISWAQLLFFIWWNIVKYESLDSYGYVHAFLHTDRGWSRGAGCLRSDQAGDMNWCENQQLWNSKFQITLASFCEKGIKDHPSMWTMYTTEENFFDIICKWCSLPFFIILFTD